MRKHLEKGAFLFAFFDFFSILGQCKNAAHRGILVSPVRIRAIQSFEKNEEKALKCRNKFLPLCQEKRMSMKKKDLETYLGKSALVYALECAFDLNRGCGCEFWYPEEKDWIKFTFDGHRCKLLSVDGVDADECTIKMTVLTGGEVVSLEEVKIHHFRYEKLRRIVEEYYMCSGACHNDTWESDVDEFIKDKMADFFDTYDEFMGYR